MYKITSYGFKARKPIQPLQYNNDEDAFAEHPFDCIFEMDDNKLFPLGIQFIFFSGWHYNPVLLKHDTKSPLFCIGTPLPDVLYKMMNLSKEKWGSITLDAALEHNKKVLASENKHTYYNFCKSADAFLKSETKKYLSDNLPAGTMISLDRTFLDTYDNSIPRYNFRVIPIYTA